MPEPQERIRRSPLHEASLALGGKMVAFAGWEMPVQFAGVLAEHLAVRENCGVFDISHMGEISVSGTGVGEWLDGLLTNRVAALAVGEGQYSLLCNEGGGVIDDLIVYRSGEASFFLVVNAALAEEDLAWLRSHQVDGVVIDDQSDGFAALAVQGPRSPEVWDAASGGAGDLPPRNGTAVFPGGVRVCRTGYTGEDGFELFCPVADGSGWWARVVKAGAQPCGLGARDSLRLEMGYPLNGSDLTPDRTPLEAGLKFFVDLDKDFIGAAAMRTQAEAGLLSKLSAFRMDGKGAPPRHGYPVLHAGQPVGEVTSGGHSPSLGCGIGLAYLPVGCSRPGTGVAVDVRGRQLPATVVKKPIYTPRR